MAAVTKTILIFCVFFRSLVALCNSSPAFDRLLPDEKNTIEIFQRVGPAVVFINTSTLSRNPFTFDVNLVPQGSGSGFVWNADGYIVTNNHVVENARRIEVTFGDKTKYVAKVIGSDPSVDIAVLKIEMKRGRVNSFVTLGDSSDLLVGQKVVAIGNPFGLDRTLTTGVLSALGREIDAPNKRKIKDVLQTDASINPGNSGGPLLDSSGNVIGINTMIFSPSGASAGIGFAVPINTLKRVVPQLIRHGYVKRASLGIGTINDYVARRNNIEGVIVGEVMAGQAAAKAGVRALSLNENGEVILGDVIVGIDDAVIKTTEDLMNVLEEKSPGTQVKLHLKREKLKLTVTMTLESTK
jgi:S1-C subfamily serine protease